MKKANLMYVVQYGTKKGDYECLNVDSVWKTKKQAYERYRDLKKDNEGWTSPQYVVTLERLEFTEDGKIADSEYNLGDTIIERYEGDVKR